MMVALGCGARYCRAIVFFLVVCSAFSLELQAQDYSILEKAGSNPPEQESSGVLPAPEAIPAPTPLGAAPVENATPKAAPTQPPEPKAPNPSTVPPVPQPFPSPSMAPEPQVSPSSQRPTNPAQRPTSPAQRRTNPAQAQQSSPKPISPSAAGARGWPNPASTQPEALPRTSNSPLVPSVLILGSRFGRGIAIPLPPTPLAPPITRIPPVGFGPPPLPAIFGARPPAPRAFGPFGGRFRR